MKKYYKNAEEYTSPIVKIFKIDNTYIIYTEKFDLSLNHLLNLNKSHNF